MADLQFFGKLLHLPLFQGLSKGELETIVGSTKFDFASYKAGECIVKVDEPCSNLVILMNGEIKNVTTSHDHQYQSMEYLQGPLIIQPESLFGLNQRYTKTVVATTVCRVISLSKTEVLHLTDTYVIFKFNLLNILSTLSQKQEQNKWISLPQSLEDRIKHFFLQHSNRPAGRKTFVITMATLAIAVNEDKRKVSHALKQLQTQGLVKLSRGHIEIPAMERFFG